MDDFDHQPELTERDSGRIMGSSRYYRVNTAPEDIAIGFTFLGIAFWGGAVNREMKALMLAHAFAHFERVWFHIDPTNLRSQAATQKIGARFVRDEVNNLSSDGGIWKCYAITRSEWAG